MDTSYNFIDKDPIIDLLRTLIDSYSAIENVSFHTALKHIELGTNGRLKLSTTRNWFYGSTKWPQYRHVARCALFLRRYSSRPIEIGERKAYPALRAIKTKGV